MLPGLLRTISKSQLSLLLRRGATRSGEVLTATEDQMWGVLGESQQALLGRRNQLDSGGIPEWVPQGALVHADFQNSLYWDGSEVVAVGDLFGQNPGNWGPFNPETDIDENGIVSGSPILVGAALAAALGGSTLLFTFNALEGGSLSCEAIKSADFSTDLYMNSGASLSDFVLVKDWIAAVEDTEAPGTVVGGNKLAFTLSATKLSASLNGDTVATCAATVPTVIDEIAFSSASSQIRSLTIYSQQDDANLPVLSE